MLITFGSWKVENFWKINVSPGVWILVCKIWILEYCTGLFFFLEHTSGKVFHFSPTKFCLQAFIFFLQKPKGDPKRIFPHTITIFSNRKVVRKRKNINREIFFELKLNSQCSISGESIWAVQRICIFILGVRWFIMMYYMFLDSN